MCFLQVVVIALSYGVVFMGGGVGPSNYNNLWVLFGRKFFWSLTSCIFCPVFWCRVLSQGFNIFWIRNRKVHLWQWLYLKGCIIIFYHGLRFWQFCLKSNLSILLDTTRKLPWVMTMRRLVRGDCSHHHPYDTLASAVSNAGELWLFIVWSNFSQNSVNCCCCLSDSC